MIFRLFGLQSLQLAARRDLELYVSFVRQHVAPKPTWKQEVAASKRIRSVKRITTFRRLADDKKVISTVTGQIIFCAPEWVESFLEYLVPCSKAKQTVLAMQQFYRWLNNERLCEYDPSLVVVPLRLQSARVMGRPACFRTGYPVKQTLSNSSED